MPRPDFSFDDLTLRVPIVLAPMAGGPGTPELAAAVSNAGGLGSIGAAYLPPETIVAQARRTRDLTDRPFAVNLFVAETPPPPPPERVAAWLERLAPLHADLGLPPPALPEVVAESFEAQLDALLEARPAVASFTFGIPTAAHLERLRQQRILTVGTATTVREAHLLDEAGVDAIVVQGREAGGHRGTFASPFEEALVPTLSLVEQAVHVTDRPVIASGNLMDGRDIARALGAGARLVQLGTAFLACPEAGTSEPYRRALRDARDTALITAYSGRPARGLRNAFLDATHDLPPLPYPYQNALTRPMRQAATRAGRAEFLSLWAGEGVARLRELPAADLTQTLVREWQTARADGR